MPIDSSQSALRKMAGLSDEVVADQAPPPSPVEAALATALLRVVDGIKGLEVSVKDKSSMERTAGTAFDDLPDHGLCLMIDPPMGPDGVGPAGDALASVTGVLVLDPGCVDALIEVQTIGRVDATARPPRRPTRIDAALAQPFAQELMHQTVRQLPGDYWGPRPGALRSGTYLAGVSSLPVVLTAKGFVRIDIGVELGEAARPSRLSLLLPNAAGDDVTDDASAIAAPDPDWAKRLDATARVAPVRLEAQLPPVRMTLSDLVALKPGDLVDVEQGALEDLRLVSGASGMGNTNRKRMPYGVSVSARLGQLNGVRAVRVETGPNDSPRPNDEELTALPGPGSKSGGAGSALGANIATGVAPTSLGSANGSRDDLGLLGSAGLGGVDDGMPALPDLPDLPEMGELPALPDLPDLPDLPELP